MDSCELIVVDDGSTDRTTAVISEVLSENQNTTFSTRMIYQYNQGESAARNAGMHCAKGEYLTFIDSDDIVLPGYLSKLCETAEQENADIVFCGFDVVDEEQRTLKAYHELFGYLERPLRGYRAAEEMLKTRIRVIIGSAVYRTDLLRENSLHFTLGCPYEEDLEFILKALFSAKKVASIDETLFRYVQRSDGAHVARTSHKLFHSLGARRRLSAFLHERKAPRTLVDHVDSKLIPESYVAVLVALLNEGVSKREMKKTLAKPVVRKILIDLSSRPDMKTTTAFILKHFPLVFLRLWAYRENRRNVGRYF
jgi:glycosyltransferase involved in cell wall biosynthesis